MNHILDALDKGEDIGHYGRLTFAMIAHYFVDNEKLVELLAKNLRQGTGGKPLCEECERLDSAGGPIGNLTGL